MSRLYDALKEATRFRENPEGTAGESVWEALGINEVEQPPEAPVETAAVLEAEPSEAGGGVVLLSESPVVPTEMAPAEVVSGAGYITEPVRVAPRITIEIPPAFKAPATAPAPAVDPIDVPIPAPAPMTRPVVPIGNRSIIALDKKARLIPNATNPVIVERYRMLRTKLIQERDKKPFKSLVIASPSPQEGKTVTVLNLALSFAMLPSFRVLVVDGDMRRGTLGQWVGVDDNHIGLSNLLDGSAEFEDVLIKSEDLALHFIVRGNSLVPDLHSSHFTEHFKRMAEEYDLVLVDSPPVNAINDVQLLAANCDAVLLVARAFSSTRKALEQAAHNLQPFRVIGSVLNAGLSQRAHGYDGYY